MQPPNDVYFAARRGKRDVALSRQRRDVVLQLRVASKHKGESGLWSCGVDMNTTSVRAWGIAHS